MNPISVGKSLPRIDADEKVRGSALYPRIFPGRLCGRPIFCWQAVRAPSSVPLKRHAPLQFPVLIAVFTAADVPHNLCGQIISDCPVLCRDLVRYAGDKVAVVVAETDAAAIQALDLIHVEYEDTPAITDMEHALDAGALLVNPEWGSNLISETTAKQGDLEAGFNQADVIIEGEYATGAQEHAFLAPESGLAYVDDQGCLTIETAGQSAHEDQRQIADALQIPLEKVRVIYSTIGGLLAGVRMFQCRLFWRWPPGDFAAR